MITVTKALDNNIYFTPDSATWSAVWQQLPSFPAKTLKSAAVALGKFDGVHRGHQRVIQPILNFAGASLADETAPLTQISRDLFCRTMSGNDRVNLSQTYATVVTFNPHPQEFFTGETCALLTPLNEKVQQMQCLGVEQLVILPFDRELADLSPQQFVEKILVQQLRSQRISVGEDFRFGKARVGTATDLQTIAATYNIPVTIVPLQTSDGERISSSSIRQALQQGDLECANQFLGRPYSLIGTVIKGQQLRRTIGFPTANFQLPPEKFLPRQGVYAVRVSMEEGTELGVMNIGVRPTVNGTSPSVQVHLLDWAGDLYGKTITVHLEKFLRPKQKFASKEALKAQIQADCAVAKSFLSAQSNF
jgi:riboflavin kinase/FMN adenylyltransferase